MAKLALGEDPKPPRAYMANWSFGSAVTPVFMSSVLATGVLLVLAAFFVLHRATSLEVSASPSAESIYQRTGTVKTLTNRAVQAWARSCVQMMESWNNETITDQATRVAPYVHARYRATIAEEYAGLIAQVKGLWFSRAVSVYEPTISSAGDGRYTVSVPYEQFDYSGTTRENRLAVTPTAMVVEIDVIQDLGSDDNPAGLLIVGRTRMDRDAWLKQGRTDYWKNIKNKTVR